MKCFVAYNGGTYADQDTSIQVRYAATELSSAKSARARGSYLRVSFKNTREASRVIQGWKLQRAIQFLENVQQHKEAVPMRRYAGGTGRAAQGEHNHSQRFDRKRSCE